MSFLEGKSTREKLLVIGLIAAMVFGTYVLTRVSALNKEVVKLEEGYKKEKKKLTRLNKETGDIKPSSQLIRQTKELEKKLKTERENLKAFDFEFVDLNNEEKLLQQIADITIAAENKQLRILSKTNELRSLTSMMGNALSILSSSTVKNNKANRKSAILKQKSLLNSDVANNQLKRRMYRLKLRGSFQSTYDFIRDLQTLDYGVLVTRVSITADDKSTYNGIRLVITDITLAI